MRETSHREAAKRLQQRILRTGAPPGADVVGLAAIWLEKRGVPRNAEEVTVAILRDAGN